MATMNFNETRQIIAQMIALLQVLVAYMVKNLPAVWKTCVPSLVGKIPWRREWQPVQYSCLEKSID